METHEQENIDISESENEDINEVVVDVEVSFYHLELFNVFPRTSCCFHKHNLFRPTMTS